MTVNSFNTAKHDANRYRRSIQGLRDQTGSGAHVYHRGPLVAMHSAAPPPVAEYDAWLVSQVSNDPRGRSPLTGAKLRRIVLMTRNGSSQREIATATGLKVGTVHKWLHALPPELAA